ncbi:transposase [Wenzhouxiangella sp. XN79A]|uniref:transposase n=1 Tax=Wenzhouxiangella sp. XN79A TaxID=2724193 RepID=UPI00144A93A7|nr:transposase [Wenzhouxiangella sp. XN79A]NKI36317.1 transposase [Wenzhouxiangella sp. XN79A]
MPQARKRLVSTEMTPFYHVVSRCVRRQFLCGLDPLTGRDYSGRKQEIKDRLALLSEVFAVDVCAYAILSNHYHLVLHVDPERAMAWDDLELARRWTRLFRGPAVVRAFANGQSLTEAQEKVARKHLAEYRNRLGSLSWFMKCLNEPIARQANAEDNVTGHFWQSRFYSQALLDEAAVLGIMAYVDLNPIRASIAETPETSDYTSVQQRIEEWQQRKAARSEDPVPASENQPNDCDSLDETIVQLLRFSDDAEAGDGPVIPSSTEDYLELVDWSGRAIIQGKSGSIPGELPPILRRLNMNPEKYLAFVRKPKSGFANALGALDKLKEFARHFDKRFLRGQTAAAALFSPGR